MCLNTCVIKRHEISTRLVAVCSRQNKRDVELGRDVILSKASFSLFFKYLLQTLGILSVKLYTG